MRRRAGRPPLRPASTRTVLPRVLALEGQLAALRSQAQLLAGMQEVEDLARALREDLEAGQAAVARPLPRLRQPGQGSHLRNGDQRPGPEMA